VNSGEGRGETPALVLQDVHKSFGENEVLKGIDLTVEPHEVVCLIGASGSGKSTILKCVNLTEPVDSGRIVVEGEEITSPRVDVNRVRRKIGIVFQAFNLFPHMSVRENITLAPRQVLKLDRKAAEGRALELLERFGLVDKRDEYPDRLSGGQQQRVAIARALVSKPTVIFADEPTGNLDSKTGGEILELLHESVEALGQTMVMVTHEARAASFADRVLFLADGQIVRDLGRASEQEILQTIRDVTLK
jgi:polar amino acid transport system ATP-binding protein